MDDGWIFLLIPHSLLSPSLAAPPAARRAAPEKSSGSSPRPLVMCDTPWKSKRRPQGQSKSPSSNVRMPVRHNATGRASCPVHPYVCTYIRLVLPCMVHTYWPCTRTAMVRMHEQACERVVFLAPSHVRSTVAFIHGNSTEHFNDRDRGQGTVNRDLRQGPSTGTVARDRRPGSSPGTDHFGASHPALSGWSGTPPTSSRDRKCTCSMHSSETRSMLGPSLVFSTSSSTSVLPSTADDPGISLTNEFSAASEVRVGCRTDPSPFLCSSAFALVPARSCPLLCTCPAICLPLPRVACSIYPMRQIAAYNVGLASDCPFAKGKPGHSGGSKQTQVPSPGHPR